MAEKLGNDQVTELERHMVRVPTVSIGMPVYNGEKYIREALDSLLSQTFADFELVISDNASSDQTQSICEEYAAKDYRVRYVRQRLNIGAGKNFEYVLDHSSGKYFMWAAHDDVWADNWIEALVSEMRAGDFAVRGSIRFIRGNNILVERQPPNYKKGDYIRFYLAEETTMNARNFYIYGLFDRKKLLRMDRFPLSYDYYPDFLFTFQMLEKGDLRAVSGTFQIYRMHAKNTGTEMMQKNLGFARLIYKVHPARYYRQYFNIAPVGIKPLLVVLSPIKHTHNQLHLWWRGFKTIILKIENI